MNAHLIYHASILKQRLNIVMWIRNFPSKNIFILNLNILKFYKTGQVITVLRVSLVTFETHIKLGLKKQFQVYYKIYTYM